MLVVHHLGKNVSVVSTMAGRRYQYEYKRSQTEGSTRSTFSDELEELEELHQKELEDEKNN